MNVECVVTSLRRPRNRSHSSTRSASHLSDLEIPMTFAARVLIASPCSVTTSASDDEFNMPTDTPRWNRSSHFPLLFLVWQACTRSPLRIPGSECCPFAHAACAAMSFRRCRCHTCSQVRSEFHQPGKYPCVGRAPSPEKMLQRSLQLSGLASHESHCTSDDPIGPAFSRWWSLSGTVWLPS